MSIGRCWQRGRTWVWRRSIGCSRNLRAPDWSPVTTPEVTLGEREETEFYARQLAVSPDGSTLYLATSQGLFRASAYDLTWMAAPGGIPAEADVRALALDPESPGRLLAGTASGQLWQSADYGDTWAQLVQPAPAGQAISSIAIVPDPSGGIYVATDGAGVFASVDVGRSWLPMNQGLLSTSVRALALDADHAHLYAGTYRTGVFIMALDRPADGGNMDIPTQVTSASAASQSQLRLDRAFPNPFNAAVHIPFSTAQDGPVTLTVFNAAGQRIRTLVEAYLDAGDHAISWDGTDASGRLAGTGTYLLNLRSRSGEHTAKLQLVR